MALGGLSPSSGTSGRVSKIKTESPGYPRQDTGEAYSLALRKRGDRIHRTRGPIDSETLVLKWGGVARSFDAPRFTKPKSAMLHIGVRRCSTRNSSSYPQRESGPRRLAVGQLPNISAVIAASCGPNSRNTFHPAVCAADWGRAISPTAIPPEKVPRASFVHDRPVVISKGRALFLTV